MSLYYKDTPQKIAFTDENRTYRNNDVKLKSLKFGKTENKVFHLNDINNFHLMLKNLWLDLMAL